MSSIIEGYNYDIFISYRQKDNKYDSWVTEFVDNLKRELEATFKEEISVYFDINPHDGLLETHDVAESLKEKLNCLVFIPIISRTYCDPQSFAWEHELKAFIDQASRDPFGLKVRLPNGNVANRVLPVQIHDLDKDDMKLCESTLAGFIRGVEFIYKEAGVNRPLMPGDDEKTNLNKTRYRNQINKMALAIKEVITAMCHAENKQWEAHKDVPEQATFTQRSKKTKIITGAIIVVTLLILGFWVVPKLFNHEEGSEKSIAVLPFKNLSQEAGNEYFVDGLVEDLLNRISVIEDLKVISRTSSEMYRERGQQSVSQIADQLGVSYILEGSVQRYGDRARVTVQLIDAINDNHVWADNFDRDLKDIFETQSEIAMRIASELKLILTAGQKTYLQENKTKNLRAFEYYQMGRFFWNKRTGDGYSKSIEYFEKAIGEDPGYGLAYAGLADTYNLMALQGWIDTQEGRNKAVELAFQALELDGNLAEAYTVLGSIYDYVDWDWEKAEEAFKSALELNPNYATVHHYYSQHLHITGRVEEAWLHINKALELDPLSFVIRYVIGYEMYYNEGRFTEALAAIQKCNELQENHPWLPNSEFKIYWQLGEEEKAYESLKKVLIRDSVYNLQEAENIFRESGLNAVIDWKIGIDSMLTERRYQALGIASIYGMIGEDGRAMNWLEKASDMHSISPTIGFSIHFRNLRKNPKFIAILKEMGLSE
jgi:TolB-like protein/Flp pilus assembly protein TadD